MENKNEILETIKCLKEKLNRLDYNKNIKSIVMKILIELELSPNNCATITNDNYSKSYFSIYNGGLKLHTRLYDSNGNPTIKKTEQMTLIDLIFYIEQNPQFFFIQKNNNKLKF